MTKNDLLQICHEVQKLSKHLFRGWRFTRIIISKDDNLYDILGGLAKMARGLKYSWRMDDQKQGLDMEYGDCKREDEQERKRRNDQFISNDWKSWSNLPQGWKTKIPSLPIINVSYSASNNHDFDEPIEYEITSEEDLLEGITRVVYQEGNSDIDPYNAVFDTGCPKTVCGNSFIDSFIVSKGKYETVKREYENQHFKFGDGKVFHSNMSHEIKIEIVGFKTTSKTSVVDVNIPLLLGMDYLKKWGIVINTGKDELYIRKSNESFKSDTKSLEIANTKWQNFAQTGRKTCV